MNVKPIVLSRLSGIKQLDGVYPTSAAKGEESRIAWRSIAASMTSNEVVATTEKSRAVLKSTLSSGEAVDSAAQMFSGSSGMREQYAGFAKAGIGLFHGSREYAKLSLNERGNRGGNRSIKRVMLDNSRILLEPDRVIIGFQASAKAGERREILKKYNLVPIESGGLPPHCIRAALTSGLALDVAVALMNKKAVAFAEPDFLEHIGVRAAPKDPLYKDQWHHKNIGCEAAWRSSTGKGVKIVVIDNGFDTAHADLAFAKLSGCYRRTPDFVDADFVAGTKNMPDEDHGTACAGMIAAKTNKIGGCGVAYGSDLSMVACLTDQVGTQSTLARAIGYAAKPASEKIDRDGADIIACSLGPNTAAWTISQTLSLAIEVAATKGRQGKGIAIFWACTNGNYPISADQVCSHPRVSAVGRSTKDDLDDGSGFGPELEFLAPGVDVLIPSSGSNGYQTTTGTSFAAPCAAGVAALALAKNPGLKATELRDLLRASCDKVGPLPYVNKRNPRFGHGRINAERAVAEALRLAAGT